MEQRKNERTNANEEEEPKQNRNRGTLVPIGGAEDKEEDRAILRRLVRLAGGADGHIVVLPTASRHQRVGQRYGELFRRLGVGSVSIVAIRSREDGEREDLLETIRQATLLFFTGGNQLRLSTMLGGTQVAGLIRRLFRYEALHVAGTSAGAAIMPEHMIAGGTSGATPTARSVILAPGLGLTNALIIDQHFRERDRLGRLLAAISYNPYLTGVGLDEDTAFFLGADGIFEVVGSGGVTVVDPSNLRRSTMGQNRPSKAVSLVGLTMHILTEGACYDTRTHEVYMPDESPRGQDDDIREKIGSP